MNYILPGFALLCVGLGLWKRVPLYDAFSEGVREGLDTARRVAVPLITMLCAVGAFSASGLTDRLCGLLAPVCGAVGIPQEVLPLFLLRPLSGSASTAMLQTILARWGADSRVGLTASVMMGSSETVFYTCGVYLAAAGVGRSRHILPCGLLAWLAGSVTAALWYAR